MSRLAEAPWWHPRATTGEFAIVCHLLDLLKFLRLIGPPRTVEELLAIATKRCGGLTDFGSEEDKWRAGLQLVLDEYHRLNDSPLTWSGIGAYSVTEDLTNGMQKRLLLADLMRARPDVFKVDLPQPIIILGLPRSGTTLLQRLMSTHPTAVNLVRAVVACVFCL